ncbi:Prenyl protein protease [Phaffia rhodozyma]|uniref:intramembrane prenyl-peptidase Rce1 n=1 Tax=Phaffia rhodozyma TaxID=264483 RepID=A0A0F7SI39_PHARH|nr:Prenyl protein protease [Phaffia rhodozyma]
MSTAGKESLTAYPLPFDVPILSSTEAFAFSFFLTAIYVGSLYLSKSSRVFRQVLSVQSTEKDRVRKELGRNHPDVIRARIKAVMGATFICVFGIWGLVQYGSEAHKDPSEISAVPKIKTLLPTLSLLGFPLAIPASPLPLAELYSTEPGRLMQAFFWLPSPLVPFMLAPILFLGPLFTDVGLEGFNPRLAFESLGSIVGIRNYIVAPLTEEIVFRACTIAIAQLSGASWTHQIFITPLWFGLAHAHHAYDVFASGGKTMRAFQIALGSSIFQFMYTTVFGWFAAYLFVTTGSILAPLFAHTFCNIMSLPNPAYAMQRHPDRKFDIIATYIMGVLGFYYLLPKIQ